MTKSAKAGEQTQTTLRELSQLYYLRMEVQLLERRLQQEAGTPEEARLRQQRQKRLQAAVREGARLEAYIAGIRDSRLRLAFEKRFRDGENWERVADRLGISEAAVKKAVYRHIKRQGR